MLDLDFITAVAIVAITSQLGLPVFDEMIKTASLEPICTLLRAPFLSPKDWLNFSKTFEMWCLEYIGRPKTRYTDPKKALLRHEYIAMLSGITLSDIEPFTRANHTKVLVHLIHEALKLGRITPSYTDPYRKLKFKPFVDRFRQFREQFPKFQSNTYPDVVTYLKERGIDHTRLTGNNGETVIRLMLGSEVPLAPRNPRIGVMFNFRNSCIAWHSLTGMSAVVFYRPSLLASAEVVNGRAGNHLAGMLELATACGINVIDSAAISANASTDPTRVPELQRFLDPNNGEIARAEIMLFRKHTGFFKTIVGFLKFLETSKYRYIGVFSVDDETFVEHLHCVDRLELISCLNDTLETIKTLNPLQHDNDWCFDNRHGISQPDRAPHSRNPDAPYGARARLFVWNLIDEYTNSELRAGHRGEFGFEMEDDLHQARKKTIVEAARSTGSKNMQNTPGNNGGENGGNNHGGPNRKRNDCSNRTAPYLTWRGNQSGKFHPNHVEIQAPRSNSNATKVHLWPQQPHQPQQHTAHAGNAYYPQKYYGYV